MLLKLFHPVANPITVLQLVTHCAEKQPFYASLRAGGFVMLVQPLPQNTLIMNDLYFRRTAKSSLLKAPLCGTS